MQLTQATDYAFRAVLHLATSSEEIVRAQIIAEKEEIPMRFLLKIMRSLIGVGIVKSYRGVEGGYGLGRPAEAITLWDVVEAVEGPSTINRCLKSKEYCSKNWSQPCPVHQALNKIQKSLETELKGYNFSELAKEM